MTIHGSTVPAAQDLPQVQPYERYSDEEVCRQDEIAQAVNHQVDRYGLRIERLKLEDSDIPRRYGMAWAVLRHGRMLINTSLPSSDHDTFSMRRKRWSLEDACQLALRIAHIAKSWEAWDMEYGGEG